MWNNAAVTFRAGVLVGPADMLSRLSDGRSESELAALIPDNHKPVSVDRGNTAHLEAGESGPTDSIRALGLPMQRLAMLKPPDPQQFMTAKQNFDACEDRNKDKGLHADNPLAHARQKEKHDFEGLKDWFSPGCANKESIKNLILDVDDIGKVATVTWISTTHPQPDDQMSGTAHAV
jgi:hypothetical protein